MVNFELPEGSPKMKLPIIYVLVTIDDREPFPLDLIKDKEWENFQRCMNLIMKNWTWTAFLKGEKWCNDDRKPKDHDEIQVTLAKLRDPVQKAVQVFVKTGSDSTQITHLQVGREWEHFKEWMAIHHLIDRWSASFNGRAWEDDTRAPTRDQTIHVNITGQGGGRKSNLTEVWVKIGNTPKKRVSLIWKMEDCWNDFRTKVNEELGHDAWSAKIKRKTGKGIKWFDNSIKPSKEDTIVVKVLDEEVSQIDVGPPAPIPERMVTHPKHIEPDRCPEELMDSLDQALAYAPSSKLGAYRSRKKYESRSVIDN
jgi:hypothetical protein